MEDFLYFCKERGLVGAEQYCKSCEYGHLEIVKWLLSLDKNIKNYFVIVVKVTILKQRNG
jgi:hypothetical protein